MSMNLRHSTTNPKGSLRQHLFMVLDSQCCPAFGSAGEQLTACGGVKGSAASAPLKPSTVVKHRRPLRGWQGAPNGESIVWELLLTIFSMSRLQMMEVNKSQFDKGTVRGIIKELEGDGSYPP